MVDDPTATSAGDTSHTTRRPTRWTVVVGTLVVALSLLWLVVDMMLAGYTQRGGGTNIGRGLIIFGCYGSIVAGLVTIAIGGGFRIRAWRWWSWVAAGTVVALFAAVVVVRIVQPRDEEAGLVGRLGVTVSATGEPVLVFAICRGSIDRVQIAGPNRGSVPNEVLARYRTTTSLPNGSQLNLGAPSAEWTADRAMTRADVAAQKLVIASAVGDKASLTGVAFSGGDLESLGPDEVLAGSGPYAQRRPAEDFVASGCTFGR